MYSVARLRRAHMCVVCVYAVQYSQPVSTQMQIIKQMAHRSISTHACDSVHVCGADTAAPNHMDALEAKQNDVS